jgi:enamine deaminase RidA (YjgF/YER057c/UK114 family)
VPEQTIAPRQHAFTGVPYEETFGYCRAIRIGDRVIASGSSALGTDGGLDPVLAGDMYGQAKKAISKIEDALNQLGVTLDHVVRTCFYVVDATKQEDAARAHGDFFGGAKPAFTMVGVPFLYGDGLLIEIEVEAIA